MFIRKLIATSILASASLSAAYAGDIDVYFNHPVNAPAQQANLETKIIDFINSAQTSVDLAVYDLDLPGIANVLVAKKAQGLTVRFITDEDNIAGENEEAINILNAGNVPWIDDTENGSAGSKIQHNKFIVVDNARVLVASANFTQSGIHGDLDGEGNLISDGNANHLVTVESSQLANIYTTQFLQMWGDGPGGAKDSLFGLGKVDHQIETAYTDNENIRLDVQFTPQSPSLYTGSTLENLENYVTAANTRIHTAQFVFSAQDVADKMKLRHDAGVEVQGVGDPSFFSRYYSEFMDMANTPKLNPNGAYETDSYTGAPDNPWSNPADVRIANLNGGDKFHHKYWIIDDLVITGSHNVSGSAAFGNDENVLVIHSSEVAAQFEGEFSRRYCEAGGSENCGSESLPEGGTWEGVSFTGAEVATVLDIVNQATLSDLDVEAAMNATAANNIIAARTIADMDQLAAVPYVGAAAMQVLKDYIPTWEAK
ncbi:phospholipase D-like domain-containing protein (plasmid) [Vibrio coralliilyticus]|uniref:phospholipase D-like domain-containing protein n=1 Tax=Vibrio coralliilyticus TaxID=190893 RepID=UPI00051290A3|nr:phospholipase D-like domain-containing protein [Vibrio coralliilyticus]AIS58276.1 phospholipase [Vibrio coralliilyticus]